VRDLDNAFARSGAGFAGCGSSCAARGFLRADFRGYDLGIVAVLRLPFFVPGFAVAGGGPGGMKGGSWLSGRGMKEGG
jgi:hypothetical protein